MELSIVIPAYNEDKRLSRTLDRIIEFFKEERISFEVIVVNDGSTDDTRKSIQEYCEKYKQVRLVDNGVNRGKGYSVKRGVKKSTGDLILFSDADLSTPIEEYAKLNFFIEKGYDIAIGSRRIEGAEIVIKQPLYRRVLGRGFGVLTELIAIKGIKDTQCGFKLFRGDLARKVFDLQRIDGYSFDVEILFISRKKFGSKIKEIPVKWIDSAALSKVNAGKETFRMFKDLIKVRLIH